MKKILYIIILIASYLQAQTWTGTGTKIDPYIIDTPQEFQDMGNNLYVGIDEGAYFALGADLDFTGFGTFSPIDGTGTETCGNYLDGRGFTVKNMDLACGIVFASGNQTQGGIWRGMRFSTTTIDTLTPVLQNITFDSLNLVGTGTFDGVQNTTLIYYGVIAGTALARASYYGGSADSSVLTTPLWDSVVIGHIDYSNLTGQSYLYAKEHDDAVIGGAVAYVAGWFRNIKMENDFYCAFEDVTKDITSVGTGAVAGHFAGISLWHTKLEGIAIIGNATMYETDNANRIVTMGGLIGGPRYYSHWIIDCFVQGNITVSQTGGTAMTSRVGGLFGSHGEQSLGYHVNVQSSYFAGVITTTSLDDPGLCWGNTLYGHDINNFFADTTISTLGDIYNTVTNAPALLAGSGQTEAQMKKTTAEMQTQSTFEAAYGAPFDFSNDWFILASSYPELLWYNGTTPLTITILAPVDASNQLYPITVSWTGTGNYDSAFVYLNDVLADSILADTTYTITTGSIGSLEIKITAYDDESARDSVTVNALTVGTFLLDSAYAAGNTLSYEVRFGNIIGSDDSIKFYVGRSLSELSYVGIIAAPSGYKDTTYSFTKPSGFWSSGTVWYKIQTQEDSTDNYTIQSLDFLGQVGGTQICWDPVQSYAIEVRAIRDLSCGWVSGIERTYTTASLRIPNNTTTTPYFTFDENACFSPYVGCTYSQRTFLAQDTTGGGVAVTTEKFAETAAYLNNGTRTATLNQRQYYLANQKIYMDDIANGVDSLEIYDLSTYYSTNQMIDPKLWWFVYHTEITDTVQHDGTIDTELPARTYPLVVIYEDAGFQRMWSFDAYIAPPVYGTVLSDTFLATESITDSRDYFRGIDPKFIREPQ